MMTAVRMAGATHISTVAIRGREDDRFVLRLRARRGAPGALGDFDRRRRSRRAGRNRDVPDTARWA
jgi:hypothetical protein